MAALQDGGSRVGALKQVMNAPCRRPKPGQHLDRDSPANRADCSRSCLS